MQKSLVILSAGLLMIALPIQAQYVGPSSIPSYNTVETILDDPIDDMPVVLDGFIIKKVGKEKYIFTDGTGDIRIDLDNKYLPAQTFDDKTKVRIRGEVEKDFLQSPEIDIEHPVVILP